MNEQDNTPVEQPGLVVNPSGWSPVLEEVAKVIAELKVGISTRGGNDDTEEVYKRFREVYKQNDGPYSTVYLPLGHTKIDSSDEHADAVIYRGDDRDYRDLIMLKSAKSLAAVAVPGTVPGLQVKDVIQAIRDRKIHVIVYEAETSGNDMFMDKLRNFSPDVADSPLLHPVYDIDSFRATLRAIENDEV